MNCPRCGRPLAEGEICNCAANETYPQVPIAPEATAAPVVPEYQEPAAPQPEYTHPQPEYTHPQPEYAQPQPEFVPPYQPQPVYAPPVAMAPIPRTDYPEGYKIKKKLVAVILGWTLGYLGIHNFYLGNQNKAIAQLLICLIGNLFFGLGFIAAAVWAMVDTVKLLTESNNIDGNGFKIMTFEESLVRTRMEAEKNAE